MSSIAISPKLSWVVLLLLIFSTACSSTPQIEQIACGHNGRDEPKQFSSSRGLVRGGRLGLGGFSHDSKMMLVRDPSTFPNPSRGQTTQLAPKSRTSQTDCRPSSRDRAAHLGPFQSPQADRCAPSRNRATKRGVRSKDGLPRGSRGPLLPRLQGGWTDRRRCPSRQRDARSVGFGCLQ